MLNFPPKTILVGFDLSDVSMDAWRHARKWAHRFGAALEVAYVEEWVHQETWQSITMSASLKKEIKEQIRKTLGPEPKIHVCQGDPAVSILRLARTRRPDLVVMGTHARTGLSRAWLGSVAETVVRFCPVPVLTARGRPEPIRSILAPVNFTGYSEQGFFYAAKIASELKARLTGLHVYVDPIKCSNPTLRLSRLGERLPEDVRKTFRLALRAEYADPVEKIVGETAKHDLVVLVAHRKSLLKDWVLGTTAERVLRHSPAPVLTIPAKKTAFMDRIVTAREELMPL